MTLTILHCTVSETILTCWKPKSERCVQLYDFNWYSTSNFVVSITTLPVIDSYFNTLINNHTIQCYSQALKYVEMSIRIKVIITSNFAEVILEILNTTIGVAIVKNLFRIWNEVKMSIMGDVITISGSAEALLEVLKSPIGVDMVEKVLRIWNHV